MTEPTLFFVLGAPKSGTTWLERALNAHPQVVCKGEGKVHFFWGQLVKATQAYNGFLIERNRQVFGQDVFPKVDLDELDAVFHAFVEGRLRRDGPWPGVKRLGAKDPDFGMYLSDIAPGFPGADYLHIVRDPRDAALSMWHHMRRVHPEVRLPDQRLSLIDTARGWSDYLRIVRAEVQRAGLNYAEIRYEDMVERPQDSLSRAFGFLKVDDDVVTIDACIAASRFEVMSGGRSAGQEDRGSFFRRGIAGGWRDELSAELGAEVLAAAGPVATELGYV